MTPSINRDPLSERQKQALNGFLSGIPLQRRSKTKTQVATYRPSAAVHVVSPVFPTVSWRQKLDISASASNASSGDEAKLKSAKTENPPNHELNAETAADDSGSENEGVQRWLVSEPRRPRKITERKRADAAAFDAWLEKNHRELADDDRPVPDNESSLAWLVKDDGSYNIIDSPFDYQVELFERAKHQNTIAVLDTGICFPENDPQRLILTSPSQALERPSLLLSLSGGLSKMNWKTGRQASLEGSPFSLLTRWP